MIHEIPNGLIPNGLIDKRDKKELYGGNNFDILPHFYIVYNMPSMCQVSIELKMHFSVVIVAVAVRFMMCE